ncbi:MAG: hypothetical protein WC797_04535 [Candidatus Paceibacterota bacterium]
MASQIDVPRYPGEEEFSFKVSSGRISSLVGVSFHAWERFCDRYATKHQLTQNMSQDFFRNLLIESFSRATPQLLPPVELARRLATHKGEEATYLFDSSVGLRFVVVKVRSVDASETSWRLVTAEIPYRNRPSAAGSRSRHHPDGRRRRQWTWTRGR